MEQLVSASPQKYFPVHGPLASAATAAYQPCHWNLQREISEGSILFCCL
jgi:hypothetical protein